MDKLNYQTGSGFAYAHHGEILQGIFEGNDKHFHQGLISLPCPQFSSTAVFEPNTSGVVSVEPLTCAKARRAAEIVLTCYGNKDIGGHLTIKSTILQRVGLGSSSADVTATIHAVTQSLNCKLSVNTIAKLAVEAEIASDPCMYGHRAVLFAQREGYIIEDFLKVLPPLDIVGFLAAPSHHGIDTLDLPLQSYNWQEAEMYRSLVGLLRRAIYLQDSSIIGFVATASARMNQRFLPTPRFNDILQLAKDANALGLQISHSGTVIGLLFDPVVSNRQEQVSQAQELINNTGFGSSWYFTTAQKED